MNYQNSKNKRYGNSPSPNKEIDYRDISKKLNQQDFLHNNSQSKYQESNFGNSSLNMFDMKALEENGLLGQLNLHDEDKEKPGSIEITHDEIKKAFKILDPKNNGGKVSLDELKKKVKILLPNFPFNDIQNLTNGRKELKSKELLNLLQDNELEGTDIFKESFSLLDPKNEGFLDTNRLKDIFKILGYGALNQKDIEILVECLDIDKDKKISIDDLRQIYEKSEFESQYKNTSFK